MEERPQCVPDSWRDQLRAGLDRLQDGDFTAAESHFARAHQLAPHSPEVCFALGREHVRRGDFSRGEALLRAAWERDPSLESAGAALARCLGLDQARFEEAHEVLDRAEQHNPHSGSLHVVRAELLLAQGRVDEAERAGLKACSLAGAQDRELVREAGRAVLARVFNQRGIDASNAGRSDLALFLFKRATDSDPEWSAPHVNSGLAFQRMGKRERALQCFELAAELEPNNPAAHLNRGLLLAERGNTEAAANALENALMLDPLAVRAAVALARIYLREGCNALAEELLQQSMPDLSSEAGELREPGDWVALASAWQELGDTRQAEACLRQALALAPRHVGACCCLADLLAREGRYLEAAKLAERAQSIDPAEAELYLTGQSRLHSDGK